MKNQTKGGRNKLIDVTWVVLSLISIFIMVILYSTVLFLASLTLNLSSKTKCSKISKEPKFLVLIPAHNEERVVGDLMVALLQQSFPKNLYRVIVIVDNCIDRTLQVCSELTSDWMKVLVRTSNQRGKGPALDYGFKNAREIFPNFEPNYVVILDADNLVREDFLKSLSVHAKENYPAIQCLIGTKNLNSLVSKIQFYNDLIFQRLWHSGKDRLRLCNGLSGTGMAIRFDVVLDQGFGHSIVDDLDFTIRMALNNMRVKFVSYPGTLDEKPDKLSIDVRRRTRWATGYIQTFLKYGWILIKRPTKLKLDAFISLGMVFSPLLLWFSGFIFVLHPLGIATSFPIPTFLRVLIPFTFIFLFSFTFLLASYSFLLQTKRKDIKYLFPSLIYAVGIALIVVPLGILNLIRGTTEWKKTPHGGAEI